MYDVPTDGCNLEIMGWPFFAENVDPTEAIRRRNTVVNNIVGGTQKITKGEYVGLDFTVTTHVKIDPDKPNQWNGVFEEMMSKPVIVSSPELGDDFKAIVVVKPEHESYDMLKLTISIKEVPGQQSLIPGEEFIVPAPRKIKVTEKKTNTKTDTKTDTKKSNGKKQMAITKRVMVSKKTKSIINNLR